MFTGIVEIIGTVAALDSDDGSRGVSGGTSLTISDCGEILQDARRGDSISINGTCLTITDFTRNTFKVGVSPETLRRTNLGSLAPHSHVNLERAVSASTRMGGHFVQGHVDTVASIVSITPDGNAFTFRLKPRDETVLRYIVEKGYVALDGASLTITKVADANGNDGGWWEVMLIPFTQEKVVMGKKSVGEEVNVEVDMTGKYVEKGVVAYLEGNGEGEASILEKIIARVVDEKLAKARSVKSG